jgi:hypothetical protein
MLTAAARILEPNRVDAPHAYPWHDEAWRMRNTTGEIRFAEMWLSSVLSRCRLFAAIRTAPDAEPEPVEDGIAAELMARFAGGVGGQAGFLRMFAPQLLTPGVGYMVGIPSVLTADRWTVHSADEIRLSSASHPEFPGVPLWEVRRGEGPQDWEVMPPGTLAVKGHRPHPRYSWDPDSPVRGALPILRELTLLTQHVEAMATSRLAGAGIFAMDAGIQFPQGWDKWVEEFLATVTKPIRDRMLAGAYAPFPLRVPLAKGEKIADKLHHLMFNTPFDEHSMELRGEALNRLATAMDMPAKILTGESSNHWGDWHVDEQGITIHAEPNLELICEALTIGYLRPGMLLGERRLAAEAAGPNVVQLREAIRPEPGQPELIVWYDTSDLHTQPDTAGNALQLHERLVIDDDDLRTGTGVVGQAPEGDALARMVWVKMLDSNDPAIVRKALVQLGLAEESDFPAAPVPVTAPPAEAPADDEAPANPGGPPGTEGDPEPRRIAPPGQAPARAPAAAAGLVSAEALMVAADGLVFRALEKAGNRLRQAMRRVPGGPPDCAAVMVHTECNAGRHRSADALLEGAWDRLPEIAARIGEPADALQAVLDDYARTLIQTRLPHSWDMLAVALGVDGELAA